MSRPADTTLPPLLAQNREALLALAERRGLRNVRVFRPMVRGDYAAYREMRKGLDGA